MTLNELISRATDRIQDICLIDYPIDGPEQRKELQLVLFDLMTAVSKLPRQLVVSGVHAEAVVTDHLAPLLYQTRGEKAEFRKRYRFLVLPDDFTVPENLDAKGKLVVP